MAPININDRDGDWLASLARQSAYAESTPNQRSSAAAAPIKRSRSKAGGGGGDGDNSSGAFATASSLTKIQRIERRDQKRIQREDRKRLAEVARQQRLSKKRRQNNDSGDKGIHAPAQSSVGTTPGRVERSVKRSTSMTAKSKQALVHLTTVLESTVSFYARPSFASTANVQRHSNRNQRDDSDSASQQQQIVNGVLADPKGKATKTSTLRPESKELQPRVRDYNGQGLVRPSLYIPFNDPSFKPKVEMEFEEHIPGFFGKAKQKAAKKQSDQNMLWKRCLKAKQLAEDGSSTRSTKRRKAKKGVGVEDRVEGLMRRGVMFDTLVRKKHMEPIIDRAVRNQAMVRIAPSEEDANIVATPVPVATPIVALPRGSIIRRNDENIIVTPVIPLPRVSIIRRNDQDIAATPALPLPRVSITRRTDQDIVVATAPPIDPLEPANQPNEEGSRPYFRNRMVICLFAIAANWGTTLSIAKQLASRVISTPSLDFVTATCEDAYNITRDERLRHTECVDSQLNQCNTRLDKSITREDDRVKVASSQNEDVVQKIEEVAINCSKSYTTLRLLLEDWTAARGEIPMRTNSSNNSSSAPVCSAEDQEQFNRTMLGTQNTIAMQTEALQVATEYSDESTTTVSRLATAVTDVDNERSSLSTYIDERVDYDIDYIDRKTTTIQDGLYDILESLDPADIPPINISDIIREFEINSKDIMACVSLDVNATMVNGTKCRPNLAALVDGFVKNAKWKVSFLTQTLYDCRDKMEEYKQNAADAYTVAKTFYDGAKTFINIAKRIVFWEPVGDWFDISDSDFSPIDVDFPNVSLAVSQIGSFSSINAMWQAVFPKIGSYYAKIPLMHSKLNARFLEKLEDIMLNTSVPISILIPRIRPTDYDPPNYTDTFNLGVNPEEEVSMYRNISEFFKTNTRTALGMFSGIRNQYDGLGLDFDVPSFNITEIKNKVTSVNLSFEGPQNPDMDFKLWFLQVANFSDGLIYLDYIVRCYVSIRLFVRYWFATALAMPFIDLRVNKETINPFRMHPARIVVSFVTSPQGLFIIFLASSAWILGMVAFLYVPLLQSYTSGCVNFDGNGTFITKNLYSVGYNYAYQDGSGLLVKGMEAFDVKLGGTCNSRYTASTNIQNTMRSNVTTYSNFHREVSESMLFARRCIDAEELDSAFTDACCGFVTYPDCPGGLPTSNITCPMDDRRAILSIPIPYELPGISLTDPSCLVQTNESDFVLSNAIFDCDNLKACNVTCPGPHKGFLNAVIERCGCTFEWYLHSKWMGDAFAFLIYTLMNIARVSFFSGVTRLLWKHIYPDRFTILATCDSEGSLVTASKANGVSHEDLINAIQSKSNGADREITKELHAKLNRCIRNFFATGVVLLLGSAVVNALWFCALFFVSRSLTPSVWQE